MMQGSDLFWTVLGGILLLALGIFMFFRPDLVWKLTERWKSYRADEPSAAFALVGLAALLLPFILK